VASIEAAVGLVPDDWFAGADPPEEYVRYLAARLDAPFAEEAERARR
jgi:hypothetical protein